MSDKFIVIAEEMGDDVLIRLPEELGIQEGQQFEAVRRPDGVVILDFTKHKNIE